ncbi:MAG: alpha/beta hydrolase [Sphingomonadales bacterium]|nr:alpha/beta hydrolase [Sphingomonadales bacterium]
MQHFLTDDGEHIHVHISGDGVPLVLLHGWTASHVEWSMFLRGLNPHYQLYRWDARAHGGYALHGSEPPSVARMARDLQNMLDHYQLDKACILGHSMGALTLWQYIQDFGTARISKAIFIDQSPRLVTDQQWKLGIYGEFDEARSAKFIAELEDDFAEAVLRLIAYGRNQRAREEYLADTPAWQRTREQFRKLRPAPLIEIWKSLTAADYRPVLPKIDVPTLLLFGGLSNFYTPETAEYVRRHIPDPRLLIYEGEDHSPHMWQRDRFIADLRAFLG